LYCQRGAGFDLAQPSQDRISSVQAKYKIYQPIDLSKINADQIIPSMLEAVKANTMVNGKPHAVPFCWGTSGMVVNRKYAPTVSDYSDLLNAFYAGRISYRLKRPTLIALAFAMGENPFAKYSNAEAYKALMEKVEQAMIAGKPFVKNYWANGDALLQSMRSGEVHVAMAWDKGGWKLHDENPNIDFFPPKSGALGWIDTFSIPAGAENIDLAYAFIEFNYRPEIAGMVISGGGFLSSVEGAPGFLDEEQAALINESFPTEAIDNINWYPALTPELEEINASMEEKLRAAVGESE